MTEFDNKYVRAAGRAIELGFGQRPVFDREGGSIPVFSTFQEDLGLPSVLFGIGLPDENAHAPHEKRSRELPQRDHRVGLPLSGDRKTRLVQVVRNLVIAVLAFVAWGCDEGHTATGPSSNGISIRGQVLDFATQAGMSGVVVQVGETPATTDASGFYTTSMPVVGSFSVSVDGVSVGTARVTGSTYRGDLLIDRGTCVSRYGTLADARTLRPVAGATVSVGSGTATEATAGTTVSGPNGWYRVDLGCPANGLIGFNTTFLYVTHPNYASRQEALGRGVRGVRRLDLDLKRR